jgi:hypothetical protein
MIKNVKHCFFLSLLMAHSYANSMVDNSFYMNDLDVDDNFYSDSITYRKPTYTPAQTLVAFTRSCSDDVAGIVEAQKIFIQDLYRFTHPINQRSLLDLPQSYFYYCLPPVCACKEWEPTIQLFYNGNYKDNFTKDSTSISSYLAFDNIPNLEQFGLEIDARRVLSLFEDLKIQEQRAGLMIGVLKKFDTWFLSFKAPFEYLIRNFFLTEAEKRAIETDPLFNDLNPTTDDEEEMMRFARRHLIADRLGIGDTRVYIGKTFIEKPRIEFDFGALLTIPTAFALLKGIYGHHFSKNIPAPNLNLNQLLNLAMTDITQAEELIGQFLLEALDRLSRILLETGLGNNGHLGIGAFAEYRMKVMPKLEFRTRAELEYLLPAQERRFFIHRKNFEEFERLNNPIDCDQSIQFLQQQIVETFFPTGFNTTVFPGFIFKFTNALSGLMANKVQVSLGHDLWWQQQEFFGKIKAPQQEVDRLRKDIAIRPPAFQSKLFASVTYFRNGSQFDWCLTAFGDKTFLRSGIGKDFNLALKLEIFV